MSVELTAKIKAIDEASEKIKQVGEKTEKAMKQVKDSAEKAEFSFKKFATSISGVMTAGFALYNAYDRIQDAQLAVTKAQNTLTQAQISAKQAQEAYNKAVEKYGINSEQAKDALEKLQLAQDKVAAAQETLKDKQDKVNEAMIQMAIQAIPTSITAITSLKGVVGELTAAFDGAKVSVLGFEASLSTLSVALGSAVGLGVVAYDTFNTLNDSTKEVSQRVDEASAKWGAFGLALNGVADAATTTDSWLIKLSTSLAEFSKSFLEIIGNIWVQLGLAKKAFENTYDEVVGHSIWTDMWDEIAKTTKEGLDENIDEIDKAMRDIQRRLSRPFYMEVVLTVNAKQIASQVQAIINELLKSVVIEKTSAQAATSRIRVPATTTPTAPTRTRERMY